MSAKSLRRAVGPASAAILGIVILFGCGKRDEPGATDAVVPKAVVLEKKEPPAIPQLLRPFREVAVQDVPEGERRPPDFTVTQKSVGRLYEMIAGHEGQPGLFDQVKFVDAKGRKIRYIAVLKTDQGDVRIELLGDSAPNHVRNFIALARAGYYDGLPFHRSVRSTLADKVEAYIESGCPLGTGEFGYGSIGYWLKPEISEEMIHDEGVVGAWHGLSAKADQPGMFEDLDNAACKFYITLAKSPWRDASFTIFGKVIQGLDVAHRINGRPNYSEQGLEDRPLQAVVIRQVVIEEVLATGAQVARN
jgi:cyclophilin family peptidyl-prolyl cis-trans isomerase